MVTKEAVAVVAAWTAVREARAAAAAAAARAAALKAVAWMEEPPVACAGSTPNYNCSTGGMSMRPPDCPGSRNNSGSSQRTAVCCHTTRAAMRASVKIAKPEIRAAAAEGRPPQRKGALSTSRFPRAWRIRGRG